MVSSLVETELEISALVASTAFSHTEKRYRSFLGNTVPFFTQNPVFVRMFWGSVAVEILFSETWACVWLVPAGLALLAPLWRQIRAHPGLGEGHGEAGQGLPTEGNTGGETGTAEEVPGMNICCPVCFPTFLFGNGVLLSFVDGDVLAHKSLTVLA